MSEVKKIEKLVAKAKKTGNLRKKGEIVNAIAEALADKDRNVRLAAARELGSFDLDSGTIKKLLKAKRDPDADVCLQAAVSLYHQGRTSDTELHRFFIDCACSNDTTLRQKAHIMLRYSQSPNAHSMVVINLHKAFLCDRVATAETLAVLGEADWRAYIRGDNDDYRRMAASGIRRLARFLVDLAKYTFDAANIRDQKTQNESQRIVDSVALIRGADSVKPLLDALRLKIMLVRIAAAKALGAIGDQSAAAPLLEAAADTNEQLFTAASQAVKQIAGTGLTALLEKQLRNPNSQVRIGMLKMLAESDAGNAQTLLLEALKDKDADVRRYAIEALGSIEVKDATHTLIEALGHKEESVRTAAIRALGEIGDMTTVEKLNRSLADESGMVRSAAAQALMKMNAADWTKHIKGEDTDFAGLHVLPAARVVPVLREAAQSKMKPELRVNALRELGLCRDKQSEELLLVALEDRSEAVRASAAEALGGLHSVKAAVPLIKTLERSFDKKRGCWKSAENTAVIIIALGKIKDPQPVPLLTSLVKNTAFTDANNVTRLMIRKEAALALIHIAKEHPEENALPQDIRALLRTPHTDSVERHHRDTRPKGVSSDCSSHTNETRVAHIDEGLGVGPRDF